MAPAPPVWPALIGIVPSMLVLLPFDDVRVWTASGNGRFRRWHGPQPNHHEIDCRKSGNLVANRGGYLSCAEIEIARSFRKVGWEASWISTCGRGNRRWRRYMAAAIRPRRPTVEPLPLLPPAIAEIALAGGPTGIPDVIAWDPADPRPVFVELKGPKDSSTGEAAWIREARRKRRIKTHDVVCLRWTFGSGPP